MQDWDIAFGVHADTINSALNLMRTDNLTIDYNDIKCYMAEFTYQDCDQNANLTAKDLCNVMP